MGYTALQKMREKNLERYGIDYPREPRNLCLKKNLGNIERACLTFIRETCEELRFDDSKAELNDFDGRSASAGMIPYNMEKDIDRICLENAIHRFMQSGASQDAFDVYFCYLEMFVGKYVQSKKMIEMLAEFETNASALLMKHRDHYAHSVYTFILGLAIYQENASIRNSYKKFYGTDDERKAAHHFLKYWGMTSLFHDIGYPFELPFEQVKSYFGDTITNVPFVAYKGMEPFVQLSEEEKKAFEKLGYSLTNGTINEVIAANIAEKMEEVYKKSVSFIEKDILSQKAEAPDKFNGFMDHAYFSGVIFLRQLIAIIGVEQITKDDLDAISAIMLHNSMYKFSITNVKNSEINEPFDINLHPLAYILMLCDELQCWDRTSYGQNSRQELHAMWCDFVFDKDAITAQYFFDKRMEYKKDFAKGTYRKMTDENNTFLKDIEAIIKINKPGTPRLNIQAHFIKNNRVTKLNASNSSYMHLYHFATALNGRYLFGDDNRASKEKLEEAFDSLSLEYKLSNILQAKEFSRHLEAIDCFYTDKPVAYELLDKFSEDNMDIIGPLEHTRWVKEKETMGWGYDEKYEDPELIIQSKLAAPCDEQAIRQASARLRECTRTHKLIIQDYDELDKTEQDKDTAPMNLMLKLIEEYDGLRIYRK